MKTHFYKICLSLILLGISLLCFTQNFAQENKYLSLNDILVKLTFTSRISTPTEEINRQLIESIKKQKVNFILNEKGEKELKKAGANNKLLKAIRENFPKNLKEIAANKQKKSSETLLKEVLFTLQETKKNNKSIAEANKLLINKICKDEKPCILSGRLRKALIKAGASKELLSAVTYMESIKRLYNVFIQHYDKQTVKQKKLAINAAREFITIAENNECKQDFSAYVKYFNHQIEFLEKWIKGYGPRPPHPPRPHYQLIKRFDKAYKKAHKTDKWKEVFKFGNEIIENIPKYKLDTTLLLASFGFNKNIKPNKSGKKFQNKTVYYAKLAIQLIGEGKSSSRYGVYNHTYKSKENALGWMNYIIGYIKFHQLNQKYEAINYFEKAFQYKSEVKKFENDVNALIHKANYEIFLENYSGSCEQKKIALKSAKNYINSPFGIDGQYISYFKLAITSLEKEINNMCI